MEDLEKLLGEAADSTNVNVNHGPNDREDLSAASRSSPWCPSCQKHAREVEEKYSRNFISIKQKIFFTDNLIQAYQRTKKQLEEVTEKSNQAVNDKTLMQAQLELLLSNEQPSMNEIETLRAKNASLEEQVENLKTQLHAMDESRKMHEESLKILKAEDSGVVHEMRKKHSQQISDLKRELTEKTDEYKKLLKAHKKLQQRVKKRSKERTKPSVGNNANNSSVQHDEPTERVVNAPVQIPDKTASTDIFMTSESENNEEVLEKSDSSPKAIEVKKQERTSSLRLTELQTSELNDIAMKWKAMSSRRPALKKMRLMDKLLETISEFCLQNKIESRNTVLKKFYDLHRDLYSARHQRWISDILRGADVRIKMSSFGKTSQNQYHSKENAGTTMSSAGETELNESDQLDTVASEHKSMNIVDTSVIKSKAAAEEGDVFVVDSGNSDDHVSVMPDLGSDVTVENVESRAVTVASLSGRERSISENSLGKREKLEDDSKELEEKIVHITSTSQENDSNAETHGDLDAVKTKEKASEQLPFTQPNEKELSHLKSIAMDWKDTVSKRPAPKKQALIDELLEKVSTFCKQHQIGSRKVVMKKFYDLYKDLYSKKHRQWLMDMVNKPDIVVTKPFSSVEPFSGSDSDKEDLAGKESPAEVAEMITIESLNTLPYEKQKSILHKAKEGEKGQKVCATDIEHGNKLGPKAADKECVSSYNKKSDALSEKNISLPSQFKPDKKRRICEDEFKSEGKKPRLGEAETPQIISRRRTRSMRMSSSSEQDDATERILLCRSPRKKLSKSSGSEKYKRLHTDSTAASSLTETPLETKTTKTTYKRISNYQSDEIEMVSEKKDTQASGKHSKLSVVDVEEIEVIESPIKNVTVASRSQVTGAEISMWADSPVETLELLDIFNEMVALGANNLSPLPKSPEETETDDVLTMGKGVHEKDCRTVVNETPLTIDNSTILPDDHRGRDSISPSTVLCTALKFVTPSKNKPTGGGSKNTDTGPMSDSIDTIVELEQDSSHRTSTDIVDESENLSHSDHSESTLLCSSDIAKDIMKPRRFSCEAPEKAVSVPPIKPPSRATSLERIRSPLIANSTTDSGQYATFPLRKEGDIPSHWHQSGSHAKGEKSDLEKELFMSDDEGSVESTNYQKAFADDLADASTSFEDDMDFVMKDMTGSSPLLSALESESDVGESGKTTVTSSALGQNHAIKAVVSVDSDSKQNDDESSSRSKDVSHGGSGISSADDRSLVIDVSDDPSSELVSQLNETNPEVTKPDLNKIMLNDDSGSLVSDQDESQENSEISGVTKSLPEGCGIEDDPFCIASSTDLGSFVKNKREVENRKIIVKDSFVAQAVVGIWRDSVRDFDLFTKGGENSGKYTIQDLPACEEKFLRQIHLLHTSGMVGEDFLTKTVIPVLMKIHNRLGSSFSHEEMFSSNAANAFFAQFLPFLTREKSTIAVNLPRMQAFLRVFVFICKMAGTFSPVYSICRYHLLWKPAANPILSLAQGLMCWPTGLKQHPVLGKTILRVLRKSLMSSQVLSHRSKAERLVQQLDWIDGQCCWNTNVDQHSCLQKQTIHDAISKIESASLSAEFEKFLQKLEDSYVGPIPTTPVFSQSTMIGLHILEFLPKESNVDDVKYQIIDKQFWPLLNLWSQHLHIHGDVDKDRKVTNTCTMAILHSFSLILAGYLLRQRQQHKDQPTTPKLQSHYKVICTLMDNLSSLYSHKAPRLVQCATASFLVRTCFCNPPVAYRSLLNWAKATASPKTTKCKRHKHLPLVIILSECEEHVIKEICAWMDQICSAKSEDSLVKCFWPD